MNTPAGRSAGPAPVNSTNNAAALLHLEHLTQWTLERQHEHVEDQLAYEQVLATFHASLRGQYVEGDSRGAAGRRSRKVERQLKKLVKASRTAAQAAEGLRTVYADHVRTVAALPGERAAKAQAKANRRGRVETFTAKSLNKASGTTPASPAPAAAPAPVQGLNDLFRQRKGA